MFPRKTLQKTLSELFKNCSKLFHSYYKITWNQNDLNNYRLLRSDQLWSVTMFYTFCRALTMKIWICVPCLYWKHCERFCTWINVQLKKIMFIQIYENCSEIKIIVKKVFFDTLNIITIFDKIYMYFFDTLLVQQMTD